MAKGCLKMYCDCKGAGPALREAIHERDAAQFDNRSGIAKNSPNSEMLEEVVHFLEDDDLTTAEFESRVDDVLQHWWQRFGLTP